MAKKSMIAKAKREPKFSTRQHNRCSRCGRPRAYYRKFGLCRICVRELASKMCIRDSLDSFEEPCEFLSDFGIMRFAGADVLKCRHRSPSEPLETV